MRRAARNAAGAIYSLPNDLLIAHAGEWVGFGPISLGYVNSRVLRYDLSALREAYEMDIRTDDSGLILRRWHYVP